jgi:polysaccharide biosynthesis/export protein
MRFWLLLALAVIMLGSCVPNRKFVYMQKDDVNKKDVKRDTILRSYDLQLTDYRIQPQDLLSIRIESLTPDEFDFIAKLSTGNQNGGAGGSTYGLLNGFLVDNQGNIELPVIGNVKVSGLSIFEAQEHFKKVLASYLKDPMVRVRLLNFRFTILGEVNNESQYVSQSVRVNFVEAIGLAGGLTEMADKSKLKIIRQRGDKSDVFYIDLLDERFLASEQFYVQQNDIIIVPALRQRPFRRYFGQNVSLFVSTVSTVLLIVNLLSQ